MKGWEPGARRFGAIVRSLRLARNWSQEQLAEYADLHPTYVSNIECGRRNVSHWTIERLAIGFGCPIAELFPVADPPSRPASEDDLSSIPA